MTGRFARIAARALAWVAAAGVGAVARPARADDTSDLESLLDNEVVTSASKSAESSHDAPAAVTVITSEQLRRHGVRNIAEALQLLAPAITTSDPSRDIEIGSRGVLASNDLNAHVLVLLDGHALNEHLSGGAPVGPELGLPIDMVDHIEVILGPGSVLYGTNAMLGVVNIVTKSGRDYAGVHIGADSQIGADYGVHAGAGARVDALGEGGGISVGIEHYHMHEPLKLQRVFVGTDAYTGAPLRTTPNGSDDGYWGGTWNDNRLDVTGAYARVDAGKWRLLARGAMTSRNNPHTLFDFDNPGENEPTKWLSVDLKYASPVSKRMDFQARLYGDYQLHDFVYQSSAAQYCLPGQTNGCQVKLAGGSEWTGLELQSRFDWGADGSEQTLLGVDGRVRNAAFVNDQTDAVTGANPGSTAYFQGVAETVGVYAQHIAALHRSLTLNVGARFDADSEFGTAFSPRAAAIFSPWDATTVKAIYSTAFRAPSPVEQNFNSPFLFVRANKLEPERVHSGELLLEQGFGSHTISTSVFYSHWDDMVVLTSLSPAELRQAKLDGELLAFLLQGFQYRNAATIDDLGITLGIDGSAAGRALSYGVSGTSVYARKKFSDGTSQLLTGSSSRFGKLHVSYDLPGMLPALGVAMYVTAPIAIDGLDPGGYPTQQFTPAQVMGRFTVTGPVPALKGLDYRLGLDLANNADGALVIGPIKRLTPDTSKPPVVHNDTVRVFVGLEYQLGS